MVGKSSGKPSLGMYKQAKVAPLDYFASVYYLTYIEQRPILTWYGSEAGKHMYPVSGDSRKCIQ